ncbi:Exonuclease 3 -5 domain-containing 1 [Paramuricea clavata]|uniref:Exonuclease 3 -5 domain-containing 1 n=1 Tax=Paramuricea clavata TaxID=317549 RepID=A0A6S7HCD2_PARCT|nr:Exonuclease 3 -5 domain-containing 1 [Paramuricea clavata]
MDSADILKVVHNCRHFSDALYHQHGVSLVNVFDIQVADAIIYRNEDTDKKLPRQTSSLISCFYEYLDLSPDEYHFHKVRLKHTKNDEMVWKNRPIHKDLIDAAAKSVMYLRELRLAQMERMMEEFIHGVDIYLSCVRDASDEVVKKKYSSTALPEMFYALPSRKRPRHRQRDYELDNNENEEQRQAWEEGHNFMVEYEQRGMRVREHKYPPFPAIPERSSPIPVHNEQSTDEGLSNDLTKAVDKLDIFEQVPKKQAEQRNSTQNMHRFSSGRGSLWPGNSGIFSQDDFPQLSSDSDSSGQSPRASSGMQKVWSSHDPRFGRGRAASLIRNAQLPGVRRPNEEPYEPSSHGGTSQQGVSSYSGINRNRTYKIGIGQHDRLQFPPDEELLNSSEIVSVPGLNAVPSGPRVRISHQ